ncbi:hypothetical protein DV36_29725 [Amycolatopsis mediterranei]|uniref:Uncharacterized protein n=1 Tax=Amycolatopsis mediterranei (strain S699) TaxID=713604 RepID=A0A9R0UAV7_AMYMS|nr:hypothetical protein RAM_28710 [Amycolatopsis mediterranei S699]KDU88508.1 hypothetical protein DV36_29725 [Amycolatopsis mediterranei]
MVKPGRAEVGSPGQAEVRAKLGEHAPVDVLEEQVSGEYAGHFEQTGRAGGGQVRGREPGVGEQAAQTAVGPDDDKGPSGQVRDPAAVHLRRGLWPTMT